MATQLPENLLLWINHYGPIALFVLLALGILILPVPDELLMVTAGTLIKAGELNSISTVIAAILGAWCGITGSYLIGAYIGSYVISTRLGELVGLRGEKFAKAQQWFAKIGKWSLVVGYFIPGVRHFTGYIAGSLKLPYYQFSLFAYLGGAFWASVFLSIGYGFGDSLFVYLHKLVSFVRHLVY